MYLSSGERFAIFTLFDIASAASCIEPNNFYQSFFSMEQFTYLIEFLWEEGTAALLKPLAKIGDITSPRFRSFSEMDIVGFLLLIGYVGGIYKFWTGFRRTNFTENKLVLALLWPVLYVMNPSYRRNFTKALKGN
jgi:hypothetical protein